MTAEQLASSCDDAHLAVRRLVLDEWATIIGLLEEMLDEHDGERSELLLPLMTA